MGRYKILITTVPFGEIDPAPIKALESEEKCKFVINPVGRKLLENELRDMISDYDILIAGTEPITKSVIENAPKLKLISRVGIGLDNVSLRTAKKRGIKVSYTADAPAPAVAELTVGHMLNLCRAISYVDRKIRAGRWKRIMGCRLHNLTIGIIGTGRIGRKVIHLLQGFSPKRILVNDINPDNHLYDLYNAVSVDKEFIYREADIISLHIPLNNANKDLIKLGEMKKMKRSSFLINTSRGGIVNEKDLYKALKKNIIKAAAVDVYEREPYHGELTKLDNCLLSCHLGSCTEDCRFDMELKATEEAIRFINGIPLENEIPEEEYEKEKELE